MSTHRQKSTILYRRLIAQIEARRQELRWSCDRLERASGLQSGYYQHVLHVDTPPGRCATWQMLDLIMAAIYPKDFDVILSGNEDCLSEVSQSNRGLHA